MKSALCLLTLFVAGELLRDTPGTLFRAFDCVVYTGATCVYAHTYVATYVWCACVLKSVFGYFAVCVLPCVGRLVCGGERCTTRAFRFSPSLSLVATQESE